MPFPDLSLLASNVGDLLPMRLSWIFMGYSPPYQFFSGALEVLSGILLLSRRTATFGALVASGVFLNVMMMNLSYDIPLKLFSMKLELLSLFLLVHEKDRLISFFIKNKTTEAGNLYDVVFTKRWMRITRIALKLAFMSHIAWYSYTFYEIYKERKAPPPHSPIAYGLYDVETFVVNKDTLPPLITDTLRWQDIVFGESGSGGSVKSSDTLFMKIYNRGEFIYDIDTVKSTIGFKKQFNDLQYGFFFRYEISDSNSIILKGKTRNDSLFIVLRKSKHHFQLTERQFHWLSEINR